MTPELVLADCGITFEEEIDDLSVESGVYSSGSIREEKLLEMKHLQEESEGSGSLPHIENIWERKLTHMQHLEVESDIIRGIPLQKTLRRFGAVWMKSAESLSQVQRQQRWEQSIKVDHFDVFLSHTWLTNGKWKFLSLLMQSSWHIFLVGWLLAVLAATPLHFTDTPSILRTTCTSLNYESSCDVHAFVHYVGIIGWSTGLALSPYLPRCRQKMCFLDVVSIPQANEDDMKRGIYAIGGFLAVSAELQLMWDQPYLERLWCVFELAAFRTCNPQGKILLRPLFLEAGLAMGIVATYMDTAFNFLLRVLDWPKVLIYLFRLALLLPSTHCLRRIAHQKHQMIYQLRNFNLAQVQCSNSFDRDFIFSGIRAWYGGVEAFTQYVRGPLADELARPFAGFEVPKSYWAVIAAPLASSEFCWVLALADAQAPLLAVLWAFLRRSSFVLLYLLCIKVLIFACDYFAAPAKLNFMKTMCIWAGETAMMFFMWQAKFFLEDTSPFWSLVSSILVVLVALLFLGDGAACLRELFQPQLLKRTAVR